VLHDADIGLFPAYLVSYHPNTYWSATDVDDNHNGIPDSVDQQTTGGTSGKGTSITVNGVGDDSVGEPISPLSSGVTPLETWLNVLATARINEAAVALLDPVSTAQYMLTIQYRVNISNSGTGWRWNTTSRTSWHYPSERVILSADKTWPDLLSSGYTYMFGSWSGYNGRIRQPSSWRTFMLMPSCNVTIIASWPTKDSKQPFRKDGSHSDNDSDDSDSD
jgi:hypothetical protein